MAECQHTFKPENWRPLNFTCGVYSISDKGRIRREVGYRARCVAGRLLKLRLNKNGYPIVMLCFQNIRRGYSIHRLVALAFLGQPPKDQIQVNHKDGVRQHNCSDNLEWCSFLENNAHKMRVLGSQSRGEQIGVSKLTADQVITIRRLLGERVTYRKVREMFHISDQTIAAIGKRRTWTHI